MTHPYTLHGWHLSYYTGKVLAVQPAADTPPPPATPQWGVPTTLTPVFKTIFAEFTPWVAQIDKQTRQATAQLAPDRFLRRVMDDVTIPTAAGLIRRAATPFTVWMAQRALDIYRAMPASDQESVRVWAQPLGGLAFLSLDLMPLQRRGLRVRPCPSTHAAERF